MLLLSEITLNPRKSRVYFRVIVVVYLFTVALIACSSVFNPVKMVLIALVTVFIWPELRNQNPCYFISEMAYRNKKWQLTCNNGTVQEWEQLTILFNNPVFQLIRMTINNQTKLITLFNDQISEVQLRQLHLLSS